MYSFQIIFIGIYDINPHCNCQSLIFEIQKGCTLETSAASGEAHHSVGKLLPRMKHVNIQLSLAQIDTCCVPSLENINSAKPRSASS